MRSGRVTTRPDPSTVLLPGPWEHRAISANGIRLHVAECGQGPLVVLLHGFPEFWWAWRHQLTGLAQAGFRAVAVDLRGYGDSDKPPRGYDLWTLAGDVAGLIRALGERSATVVGHGWGGLIGWTVTALHPRLVRSLVVLGAPHPLGLRREVLRHPRAQGRATLSHALGFQLPLWPERALTADGAELVRRVMRDWSAPRWAATQEFAEVVEHNRRAMLVPTVAHCALEYYRWGLRSQLRAEGRRFAAGVGRPVEVPVLQIHGVADPCVLPSTALASQRWAGTQARFELLDEVGHFPHHESPTGTTDLITRFLAS